jgi:hypothetical protein
MASKSYSDSELVAKPFKSYSESKLIAMRYAIYYLEGNQDTAPYVSEELDPYTMYGLFLMVVTLFNLKGFYITINCEKKVYTGLPNTGISDWLEIPLTRKNGVFVNTNKTSAKTLRFYNYFHVYSGINQSLTISPIHMVLETICEHVSNK